MLFQKEKLIFSLSIVLEQAWRIAFYYTSVN